MKSKGFFRECELGNKNMKMEIPGDYTSFTCSDRTLHKEDETDIIKKWQAVQDELDQYFMKDDNWGGIDECPLVNDIIVHSVEQGSLTWDMEFTWVATGERVRMTCSQTGQGSPYYKVTKAVEINKEIV